MSRRKIIKWTDMKRILYFVLLFVFLWLCGVTLWEFSTTDNFYSSGQQECKTSITNVKVPGVDSFCPEYRNDANFTERVFFVQMGSEKCLTPRYLCGVESAARANPNLPIFVYIHSGEPLNSPKNYGERSFGKIQNCEATEHVKKFRNVHFIFEDLIETHLKNSTFWPLYEKGLFQKSDWALIHLSDAVRLMLLRKYGGFYLDFDTITFRPLHCLRNTFSYLEDAPHIENSVVVFDKDHPFIRFITRYLVQIYDPTPRMILGPPSIAAAFKIYCMQKNLVQGNYSCHGGNNVNLIHPDAFFPLRHTGWGSFYSPTFSSDEVHYFRNSYVTHVYMANWGMKVPKTSLYASLARQYCPTVWNVTLEHNMLYDF